MTILKAARLAQGLSRNGMLQAIDDPRLNWPTYARVEDGQTLGSAAARAALEGYFGVPVAVLAMPIPIPNRDPHEEEAPVAA